RADTPFPNGVYFVPLQPLTSADFIPSALAEALGIQFYQGDEPHRQIHDYLRNKTLLLVLDNFEHLLDDLRVVSAILTTATDVKILATSRETLNLQEEWLYPVRGMHFPETLNGNLEGYSAVRLFVQSARRARPDFAVDAEQQAIFRVCQLVHGMPLAL